VDPVLIKRYPGRRLYNTADLDYVTFEDSAKMVLARRRFIVREAATGSDITAEISQQLH
jgi:polyhydroxyalkanoate synthesis regulator protein